MHDCWQEEPQKRPAFKGICLRLERLLNQEKVQYSSFMMNRPILFMSNAHDPHKLIPPPLPTPLPMSYPRKHNLHWIRRDVQ